MFCPKCATQNIDGAHFCRACGANISLIPTALTGQLPTAAPTEDRRSRRRNRSRQPSLDEGIRSSFMGLGFLAVAVALAIYGAPIGANVWWFWMLIPAFAMMGKGISEIVRARQLKSSQTTTQNQFSNLSPPQDFPRSNTNELHAPVASVTEGTTRHLGANAETRPFEFSNPQKPS
jgi:hypothetical protein